MNEAAAVLRHAPDDDGMPRGRRVIFALLAHRNESALKAQLDNIRYFHPNAGILLYNGGPDPHFAQSLSVPICPYSRPLKYGKLTRYLWDVMKWLEETNVEYEYLVNLDNDVLFVKHGFESFLDQTMEGFDCMGWELVKSRSSRDADHMVINSMWKEWHRWQPVFRLAHFNRYFNPVQVYRHHIVRRMLSFVDAAAVEAMFDDTEVWALEEIFFATLAEACGGRCRAYPGGETVNKVVHWGSNVTREQASFAVRHPDYYWIHPVKDSALIRMNRWLLSGGKPAARSGKSRGNARGSPKRRSPSLRSPGRGLKTGERRRAAKSKRRTERKRNAGQAMKRNKKREEGQVRRKRRLSRLSRGRRGRRAVPATARNFRA